MPKRQRPLSNFRFNERRPRLPTCCLPPVVLSYTFRKAKKGNFTQKRRKRLHTYAQMRPNINWWHFIPCDHITFRRLIRFEFTPPPPHKKKKKKKLASLGWRGWSCMVNSIHIFLSKKKHYY